MLDYPRKQNKLVKKIKNLMMNCYKKIKNLPNKKKLNLLKHIKTIFKTKGKQIYLQRCFQF